MRRYQSIQSEMLIREKGFHIFDEGIIWIRNTSEDIFFTKNKHEIQNHLEKIK